MLCFRILVWKLKYKTPYLLVHNKMAWTFSLVFGKILPFSGALLTGKEEKTEEGRGKKSFQLLHFVFFPGLQFREEKTTQTMFQPKLVS